MDIYKHMQAAVDKIPSSPHPTNKVAATLAGNDFIITKTNDWPPVILKAFTPDEKIGSSSGTIHAETHCILTAAKNSHTTKNASLFITDPPCPNCMKNIAEAGINKLYIDHKGFKKDWANRRGDQFENMSMRIAAKAGIDVYVIYRKEEKFEVISRHPPGYKPSEEYPPKFDTYANWNEAIAIGTKSANNEVFTILLATNSQNNNTYITVDRHPTIGYTEESVEGKVGKYSFILQPVNRALMIAAREGLKIDTQLIYSSRVPTSRELVNMIGAGITNIQITDKEKARDKHGLLALDQLVKAGLLNVQNQT